MSYYPDRICYNDGVTKYKNKSFRKGKRYRNEEPYLCPKCNRVWQPIKDYGSSPDYIIRFPKIGCTVKICLNCKEDYKYKHDQLNELNDDSHNDKMTVTMTKGEKRCQHT